MTTLDYDAQVKAIARGAGPLLIATDLDGTLAPIVDRPEGARIPAETLHVLQRLCQYCHVAVVTGRDLNTARRMVPIEEVVVVGSHGLETSFEHELLPTIDRTAMAAALERAEQAVITAVPAAYLHLEHKAISTAFHFRDQPELGPDIEAALTPLPDGLMLRRGKMVLEVMPSARGGKDRALLALADRFRSKSILVLGDDVTDVAMFRAARRLRERGAHVLILGVTGGEETPEHLADLSDGLLPSTAAVHEVLATALATIEELGR